MSPLRRRVWLLVFVASALPAFVDACGGAQLSVPADATADASDESDATSSVDGDAPLPADQPCSVDAHCRGGVCFEGICVCATPLSIQADGRCGADREPYCIDQADSGAFCRVRPAECFPDASETPGSIFENRSCGDFIAAICCFTECRGPSFECCDEGGQRGGAICVRGFKTCQPGERAVPSGASCSK